MKVGDRGRVVSFSVGYKLYRRRLLALGVTPGTEFTVTNVSPLGDPMAIEVRGFVLALRADEAKVLQVEKL